MSLNPELYEIFSTDSESEEAGIWVDLTDEISFKVRSIGSKAVLDKREELMRPFQSLIKTGGKVPEKKNEEIGRKVIAGAVIADWKGLSDTEGGPLEYSFENALRVITELPRFANFVIGISTEHENYRQVNREEDAKNS